ncbi:MAG: hypothetical protein ACLVHV_13770 [Oscillospiraceae bacterium]
MPGAGTECAGLQTPGGGDLVICTRGCLDGMTPGIDDIFWFWQAYLAEPEWQTSASRFGPVRLEFAHGIPGSVGGGLCTVNAGAFTAVRMKQVAAAYGISGCGQPALLGWEQSRNFPTGEPQPRAPPMSCGSGTFAPTPDAEPGRDLVWENYAGADGKAEASGPLGLPPPVLPWNGRWACFAALIEQAGLKGVQIGGAAVSSKHTGFVVNLGGATEADVLAR